MRQPPLARAARSVGLATALLAIGRSQACQSSTAGGVPAWLHEPAGFNGLATKAGARDYDFVLQDINGTATTTEQSASGWYDEYAAEYASGQVSIIADPSAPFPRNVLQILYPQGWSGGYTPGRTIYIHRPVNEYYLGFYFKISNPYQTVSSGHNKIAYFKTPARNLVLEFAPNGANWKFFMAEYVSDPAGSEVDHYGTVSVAPNAWTQIELVMSYATGRVTWWINGTLDGDFACNFSANAGGALNYTGFEPTYGGGGLPPKPQIDYVWYNHVHMSGRP